MSTNQDLARLFVAASRQELIGQYWPQMRECVRLLSKEQLWWRPNEASNSVGNLLLHLDGNLNQRIISVFNKLEDRRDRAREFNSRSGATAEQLLAQLSATIEEVGRILDRLTAEELAEERDLHGKTMTGIAGIYHIVAHFTLHYGQIAYIVKQLQDRELGFKAIGNK